MTGNAVLNYTCWQLSRRGSNADESLFYGVQSKALSARNAVPLGNSIADLRSDWWVITINANSDQPTCFIMRREAVQSLAQQDLNGGKCWLNPPAFDRNEYREAWDRLGSPDARHFVGERLPGA